MSSYVIAPIAMFFVVKISPSTSTVWASMTVAEALARAGGATGNGDTSNLVLTREGKSYRINLPLLAKRGLTGANIPLLNGDLLRVAHDRALAMQHEFRRAGRA